MSEISRHDVAMDLGTLMWIGDEKCPEFHDAYQFCISKVSQLALRRNLDDALCRPAANVRCVLFAQSTRRATNRQFNELLRRTYPQASVLNLLGSLCEGKRTPPDPANPTEHAYWHRWNQILPEWLKHCGVSVPLREDSAHSVAVVASTVAASEPLLDLAQSAGAAAIWCQNPSTFQIRNVDAVWWDDSAAGPASPDRWRQRLAIFRSNERQTRHAWIVNAPRYHQHRQATLGGVDMVVSKPHRIDCLLEMLACPDVSNHGSWDKRKENATALRAA